MPKPILGGSSDRHLHRHQYESDREVASILLSALKASKANQKDAVERAIIDALAINEERAHIDHLLSQGRAQEALDAILQRHELPTGKTG